MAFQERTDGQGGVRAEMGDHLPGLLSMQQRLCGLSAQPRDDRNAPKAEHEQRVMGIANHAGQFVLEYPVECGDYLFLVWNAHLQSPL